MSNVIEPSNERSKSVRSFVMEDMEDRRGDEQSIKISEKKFGEGLKYDSFQARHQREFVFDLRGQIKTDEERIKELDKKYHADFIKKTRKIEAMVIEEGMKDGMARLEPTIEAFKNAVAELNTLRDNFYRIIEKEVLDLVISVAKSVVNHEITMNKDIVVEAIKYAVKNTIDQERITIKVNSTDFEHVVSCKPDIESYAGGIKNLEFRADPSVSRGGCVIETNFGDIDSRVDINLSRIEKELKEVT